MNAFVKKIGQKWFAWTVKNPKEFFMYSMAFLSVSFIISIVQGIFFPSDMTFKIKPPVLYSKSSVGQNTLKSNDNSSLHLDLQVFEKDLPQIKIGQTIHFRLTNNPTTEYEATVFNIGSSFQNESKTIAVRCRIKGSKIGLIDGMNITGVVSLSNVTTPAVPNDAIVNTDGKYYIFVQTDKKAEEHHEEGKEEENHKEGDKNEKEDKASINFEKVEVLKGVSDMGYTAITFVKQIPVNAKIVVKGAFFVNAKLSNAGEDED